jgi:Calcium binding
MARSKRIREDKVREERIDFEIVVDAYNETERAMGWYCYLQGCLQMPFAAIWRSAQSTPMPATQIPDGLKVEVLDMAAEDDCMAEIHVLIRHGDLQLIVPLGQLECQSLNEETCQAVADWHYWLARGYEY